MSTIKLPKEYFAFFRELEKNNNKEWFDANKPRYEQFVKKPLHTLVDELIHHIRHYEPTLETTAKQCVFRINRDVRFSKDKQPYKTNLGALISVRGRKEMAYPSFYFEAGVKGVGIAGGAYMPNKEDLGALRDLVMHENAEFRKLINAKAFKDAYGEIKGDKNKILPPEFKEAAKNEPLLFNKAYYWWTDLPESIATADDCVPAIMKLYKIANPLSEFLKQAF